MECRPPADSARSPDEAGTPGPPRRIAPRHAADVIPGFNGRIERREGRLRVEWPTVVDVDPSEVEGMELRVIPGGGRVELFLRLRARASGPGVEARILFEPEHEPALRALRDQILHPAPRPAAPIDRDEAGAKDSIMAVVHATGLAAPPVLDEFPDRAPDPTPDPTPDPAPDPTPPPAPAARFRPVPRVLPVLDVTLTTDDEAWISFAPLDSTLDLIRPLASRDR